jgi:hypothetical protein
MGQRPFSSQYHRIVTIHSWLPLSYNGRALTHTPVDIRITLLKMKVRKEEVLGFF